MDPWVPLEGNPDKNLGINSNWKFIDIYSLEADYIDNSIGYEVYAIIILFPLNEELFFDILPNKNDASIYFCKQTIKNACGTMALLHALLNLKDVSNIFAPNSIICKLYEKTKDLNPFQRAKFLESFQEIAQIHNTSANQGQTETPGNLENIDLHYVTIIQHGNEILLMDGRNNGPLCLGILNGSTKLIQETAKLCRSFMEKQPNELRFSVLALINQNEQL